MSSPITPEPEHDISAILEQITKTPIPYQTIQSEIKGYRGEFAAIMASGSASFGKTATQVDKEGTVLEGAEITSPALTLVDIIAEQRHSYEKSAAGELAELYCGAAVATLLTEHPELVQTLLPQAQRYQATTFGEKPTKSMDLMYRYAESVTGTSGPFEAVKWYLTQVLMDRGMGKQMEEALGKKNEGQ